MVDGIHVFYVYIFTCYANGLLHVYLEGHDEVNITIEIKPDDTPEVAEVFTVNLVNVSDLDRLQIGAVSISYILASITLKFDIYLPISCFFKP